MAAQACVSYQNDRTTLYPYVIVLMLRPGPQYGKCMAGDPYYNFGIVSSHPINVDEVGVFSEIVSIRK